MKKYDHKSIEKKWQERWQENKAFKINKENNTKYFESEKEKFYILDMFPYPSGDGLHMGHTESYASTDIFYRYKKMKGFNVLHPQGFDAFGLPAENYAIKTGVHPKKSTQKNIENYIKQMKSLGLAYDFEESVVTSTEEYYKWTQWIFIKFFENNLAYKKTSTINWCDSCKTGLANEQVEGGRCERCKNEVTQKEVPGWFLKITDFADDLIEDLKKVDWPEHTKKNQINWIGRSEGSLIEFKIKDLKKTFKVFTTRADTLFGVTYCVLAPENKLLEELKDNIKNWQEVREYVEKTKKRTEMERLEAKTKTGVELKGVTVINPANNEEVSLFISDYVLAGYGTGAVMAVPAHDERDFEFAKKFGLKRVEVIEGDETNFAGLLKDKDKENSFKKNVKAVKEINNNTYSGVGVLVNSDKFNGMDSKEAKKAITEFVGGKTTRNYRLRDWSVSRQRYWGAPIPIVYSPEGEAVAVPEEHLPWILPEDVDFVPTGEAPLKNSKELYVRTEKIFGKGWTPETNTLDTFFDSSWYFLRYPDPHNEKEFCSKKRLKHWLPVDLYIGGQEHTYMHLLYARFFVKAMRKIGLLDFSEPFLKLRHQGMVLDEKGVKMSKSKGNVINPDEMVERFGADAVRMYMMFAGPLEDDVMWDENKVVGVYRFLEKVWDYVCMYNVMSKKYPEALNSGRFEFLINKTIKKVEDDIKNLKFNTAISQLMICISGIRRFDVNKEGKEVGGNYSLISRVDLESFLKILAPFAPHITEEIWSELGNSESIHKESWPQYDENLVKDEKINFVVQVNGKLRDVLEITVNISEEEIKILAKKSKKIQKWLDGKEIKKEIFIKGRLLNIIV
jgi:leucyl-tRNA synthetase